MHFVVSSASNQSDWVRYIDLAIEIAACNPQPEPTADSQSSASGDAQTTPVKTPPAKAPPAPMPFQPQ
jgi:hypothetical protein